MVQPQRHINQIQTSALSIAVLSLLSVCAACSAPPLAQVPEPSPSAAATPSTIVVASGKILPEGGVLKISAANAQDSRVNQILVKEGDTVQANQVIAVLQGRDRAQQDLRDAEANVAIKRAQLLKAQQGDSKTAELVAQQAAIAELNARLKSETVERQTAIAEAEATLRNAELRFRRNQGLQTEGAIKQSDLDDSQEELAKAQATLTRTQAELANTTSTLKAQLEREQANLAMLQEVRPVDIAIAQAELEQALIQVEQRKAELDDKLVRVPMAGQILRINTRIGEQVNTQQGIAELGKTNQMYAIAEVYETEITRVKLGQRATIVSEYGGFKEELQGKVDQIGLQIGKAELNQDQSNPTTDVNARVVEVKVRLDPADSRKVATLTEMQVRVKIDTSGEEG
ncbi:HlyD family efflux transporter periplasmic adaptor subunit [Phormidium tenue FACHB-886]|nr:HlyD family efflux transporter periplasmic adaptor subunit [Phormidium tenue FACHB-886]